MFDDSRLENEAALAAYDSLLRWLAESGARVRKEAHAAETASAGLPAMQRPRAVVAAGADARLLRAVLEPWCPVPFVAWPGPSLPGWAGALDLVVVLAAEGGDAAAASTVMEAVRRGCGLVVACPAHSVLAEHAASRDTTILPTQSDDSLAAAVVMLQALHSLSLGPEVNTEAVATALDRVAVECSPFADLAGNPAKELAIVLADALPLVWGGSVLAARAGRRVAETLRRMSGRPALAADAAHLLPVLTAAPPRDVFADPFADPFADAGPGEPNGGRPALLVLDDGTDEAISRELRGRLRSAAAEHDVRVHTLRCDQGPEVARYASLLVTGTYAAAYLAVGLDRPSAA